MRSFRLTGFPQKLLITRYVRLGDSHFSSVRRQQRRCFHAALPVFAGQRAKPSSADRDVLRGHKNFGLLSDKHLRQIGYDEHLCNAVVLICLKQHQGSESSNHIGAQRRWEHLVDRHMGKGHFTLYAHERDTIRLKTSRTRAIPLIARNLVSKPNATSARVVLAKYLFNIAISEGDRSSILDLAWLESKHDCSTMPEHCLAVISRAAVARTDWRAMVIYVWWLCRHPSSNYHHLMIALELCSDLIGITALPESSNSPHLQMPDDFTLPVFSTEPQLQPWRLVKDVVSRILFEHPTISSEDNAMLSDVAERGALEGIAQQAGPEYHALLDLATSLRDPKAQDAHAGIDQLEREAAVYGDDECFTQLARRYYETEDWYPTGTKHGWGNIMHCDGIKWNELAILASKTPYLMYHRIMMIALILRENGRPVRGLAYLEEHRKHFESKFPDSKKWQMDLDSFITMWDSDFKGRCKDIWEETITKKP